MTAPALPRIAPYAEWGEYTRKGRPWCELDVQVMRAVAAGKTNAWIARRMGFSTSAVARRLARLYVRIGATNAPHAVAIMIGAGALEAPRPHRKGSSR